MACVYVLEGFYGSLANAAVFASNVSMAFGPVLVILIGIGFLLKAVLK